MLDSVGSSCIVALAATLSTCGLSVRRCGYGGSVGFHDDHQIDGGHWSGRCAVRSLQIRHGYGNGDGAMWNRAFVVSASQSMGQPAQKATG